MRADVVQQFASPLTEREGSDSEHQSSSLQEGVVREVREVHVVEITSQIHERAALPDDLNFLLAVVVQ